MATKTYASKIVPRSSTAQPKKRRTPFPNYPGRLARHGLSPPVDGGVQLDQEMGLGAIIIIILVIVIVLVIIIVVIINIVIILLIIVVGEAVGRKT